MTIEEIQNINVFDGNKCPDYGIKDYINIGDNIFSTCTYNFYYREDECTPYDTKERVVKFRNKESIFQSFIPETFTNETIALKKYYSLNCKKDSDCLSNKCFKEYYLINDESPVIQCITVEKTFGFNENRCRKLLGSKCEYDNEMSH